MVTFRLSNVATSMVLFGALAACGGVKTGSVGGGTSPGVTPGSSGEVTDGVPNKGTGINGPPAARYAGHGFVVHEWGTNTIVVGSDGSMQRGLHHEEEDLPSFVYDRVKAGNLGTSVDVKMETPVTYFYSDKPTTAEVSVDFPKGVLTQWYPAARDFFPHVANQFTGDGAAMGDPVLNPRFVFPSETCAARFANGAAIGNGMLDWGTVEILGRDAKVTAQDAPIDRYSWSYARDVAANALRLPGPTASSPAETERFLFYRGLGNFALPVNIAASPDQADDGGVTITNTDGTSAVGTVFLLKVDATGGAFVVHPEGISAKGALTDAIGAGAAKPLPVYVDSLAKAMTDELDKTGLFHDEALAMVNTWKHQWFTTPGVRVLYLAPQRWTDAQIPLKVKPTPDEMRRIMVIRVEVITRAQEDADVKQVAALDTASSDAATAHFKSLGRFAEPRLRRAMSLYGVGAASKSAEFLLSQLQQANTSATIGE